MNWTQDGDLKYRIREDNQIEAVISTDFAGGTLEVKRIFAQKDKETEFSILKQIISGTTTV